MRHVLGISAYYHDSAAALVSDGKVVAAAQEERFSRIRHDERFPADAAAWCLRHAGLKPGDVDYLVYFEKPLLKFDRLLETYLAYAPRGWESFTRAIPQWLETKLHLPREIRKSFGDLPVSRLLYTSHHESHAASAFFPSQFQEAAILTIDGVGEWHTATIGHGRDNSIRLLKTLEFPHSLGLLYSAFTYFAGFKVNSGEYKLMGLAPYGEPRYEAVIRDKIVDLKEDGSLTLDMEYFRYCEGLRMTGPAFERLFGGPPRAPESRIGQREADLAASIQAVTEEAVLRMARTARKETGSRNLCMAGGVALNCVANGKLHRSGLFDEIFVTPAAGDAGGALGAAMFVDHQLLGTPRRRGKGEDALSGALLGPSFEPDVIRGLLLSRGMAHRYFDKEGDLLEIVASLLSEGKVVGWFHGRMEFGPRSLGSRSILGDPRDPTMQSRMNLRIKFRESFRPFAPSVLLEDAPRYFSFEGSSPYMLMVAPVRPELRVEPDETQKILLGDPDLSVRVNVPRSTIPAVTHVDMSARLQTVDEERHGRFCRLLREFRRQTGCSLLVNTSFNVRGEPIVCSPEDALACFLATDMDYLVLEDCLLDRRDFPRYTEEERARHIAGFGKD
jgi:carbamoyltransferase